MYSTHNARKTLGSPGLPMHRDAEERLREVARGEGMDVLGVADVEPLWEKEIHLEPKEAFRHLVRGIVMGHRLSGAVLSGLVDGPTLLYKHHYQRVNLLLDRAALRLASEIQSWGHEALPIPASQVVDWERLLGHLSHRAVAALAGLGWIGRSTLLVHPEFGAQVRYVTVLTNLPLDPGSPPVGEHLVCSLLTSGEVAKGADTGSAPTGRMADNARVQIDCGECRKCIEVCPARAIGERKEDFQVKLCYEQLKQFSRERGIGVYICGLCVKVCNGGGQ